MSSHRPRRVMRRSHLLIALSLTAALSACTSRHDKAPDTQSALAPEPPPSAKVPDPMAHFAGLIPGEWRQTAASGKSMYHAWHWGPGEHSIRRRTVGFGAGGEPWHELQVYYWHPGRKQIRVLGMSAYARGINEGAIQFDGKTAEGVSDLHQSGGVRRRMGHRWAFDGPDKYRDTLLEATGPDGLKPLVEFDLIRSKPAAPRPLTGEGEKLSDHLEAFQPFLGHVWEARGAWAAGDAIHTRTTFEWVPIADVIYARVIAPATNGEPTHLLDAYIYHHTGANALRCLALSRSGGVYEGDVTVLEDGALQLDLTGYEGEHAVRFVVRFDFEKDGTVWDRVWSLKGTDRTLLLDTHHKKQEPQKK